MPIIHGRLVCCQCGSDLGDADDIYADPACRECLDRENKQELDDDWSDDYLDEDDDEDDND